MILELGKDIILEAISYMDRKATVSHATDPSNMLMTRKRRLQIRLGSLPTFDFRLLLRLWIDDDSVLSCKEELSRQHGRVERESSPTIWSYETQMTEGASESFIMKDGDGFVAWFTEGQ